MSLYYAKINTSCCGRQRNDLVRSAARHIQRMQKVLTQMNVQLANVITDLSGVTGQPIVKAILGGNAIRTGWPSGGTTE